MKKLFFLFAIFCLMGIVFAPAGFTQAPQQEPGEFIETDIDASNFLSRPSQQMQGQPVAQLSQSDEQMTQINKSLKHLIDENQKLLGDNDKTEEELNTLRGERAIQDNRLNALVGERERLLKKSAEIEQIKQDYEKQIKGLKDELELKMQTPEYQEAKHIRDLLQETGQPVTVIGDQSAPDITGQVVPAGERASSTAKPSAAQVVVLQDTDAIEEMDKGMAELIAENQVLKKDTIKLHYNLANLFFEQGKYEMAAAEYKRVSNLMPQDAATHYNLAFVCENYLNDKQSALLHYTRYVQLEPNASDTILIKNKISELKIEMKSKIDSLLERDKPYEYE
ncbi:MAG: tetratricopeptide repeat protein [Candidatus Aceula meridiana]|nr:tetratricopeptide repeat protein [Candidatus Aceula meridiana]